MKNILVLLFVAIMLSFTGCDSNKDNQPKLNGPASTNIPSDSQILSSIRESGISIVGKLKVSENVYNIYYKNASSGEISYRAYELIHLDNDIWLINNPGYYIKRIN
jgi:hypothetical protein